MVHVLVSIFVVCVLNVVKLCFTTRLVILACCMLAIAHWAFDVIDIDETI